MDATMDEAQATKRRDEVNRRLDEIEDEIADLRDERERLEAEAAELEEDYPPPRSVGRVEFSGEVWYCDGFRAVRDAWSTPCVDDLSMESAAVEALVREAEGADEVMTVVDHAEQADGDFPVAVTDSGMILRRDWLAETLTADGSLRAFQREIFGAMRRVAAIFTADGSLVAVQMPIESTATLRDRRPAS